MLGLTACLPVSAPTPSLKWYVDADGDGYGDANDPGTVSTVQPVGYVSNKKDCNDDPTTGPAINPDATEINTDRVDHDCDGSWSKAPYAIGDYGPAGGFVFLLSNDNKNGTEMMTEPLVGVWGCDGIDIPGASGTGKGKQNTLDMIAAGCTLGLAAQSFELGGFTDWYIPGIDMFRLIAIAAGADYPTMPYGYVVSSTEISDSYVGGYDDADLANLRVGVIVAARELEKNRTYGVIYVRDF